MIVSTLAFTAIFCIIIEAILSFSIFLTISQFKKIARQAEGIVSEVNFRRSKGKPLPISELNFIKEATPNWIPSSFKNNISVILKDRIMAYLVEEGLSSRDRTNEITSRTFKDEWFLNYSYLDLQRIKKFIRNLYMPLSALSTVFVFVGGLSKLGIGPNHINFEDISKNLFIISFTMKTAALTFGIGIVGLIFSYAINFFTDQRKVIENLSEAIFQLKASRLNIRMD